MCCFDNKKDIRYIREVKYMGVKLLWTAVAIFLVAPVVNVPAASVVAAVFGLIGVVLLWLDK